MSSLLRIRQLYPSLALNERRLADYLLSQPDRARHLSSQKLADESGVSQSSVVKFAQKLGYKGFPALKLALSESLTEKDAITVHNHILSDDALKVVGEKLFTEKCSAIRATLDINSEEMLLETLRLLKQARRIVLVGIGASGLVAKDFSWKLMKIGISAVAEQDMHALLASVQALEVGDVLLAISYTGERREINLAAQEAQRIGATVLAFTGFTPNTLQQAASHCLYTVAEEQTTRSAAISSTTAQLALTDLLFMALIQRDPERASSHIRHSEALVKKLV
ncbi:MAG TPA: MurR/RpiR family transcriptional regulator [Erwinia persicina]|uniref:MurR/RpiR family transcriptional regulator n=1 Tax=Erwinia persicina TaxID=55211 RepID=A0A3S7RZX5_9GAMM|nr:MurR/RpiR family transcriptional regulator [Erwinia persicina]AXU93993.1 MurR/RpiR family transcriptional regulator [Erwinia persicina]MBC3946008.1 MurR/RpiR family transcriptional regulator [Erwinia persicina]MBD8106678.1 MurR/RpiR family transcriptional regulator [Erwinia persicina]MBD8164179.1 MurR/RpiR family transcriptional regulator [Erwinia persicina]MBD8168611.1 MurR/RpiR family transcriptional regulator [Erwinia persicina]